ncbi:PREDICTED: beta-1,3-glucan-binding protein-like isoform X2 [Papilio polytes]|uniref:beta-1,3-glucan-binding protein-like isoform X2 n=1 Tax=Papilio polytes TaxID=76194 RepID=UPI0006761F4A|nr:PREDICTED: beta-1,3-glucan-binding protein-like isoform X2 [Papilio polytes]
MSSKTHHRNHLCLYGKKAKFLDDSTLINFKFKGKIKRANNNCDDDEIIANVTALTNGRWVYEDPYVKLKFADVINYDIQYLHQYYDKYKMYMNLNVKYVVQEIVIRDDTWGCLPTVTRLRVGTACAGRIIFEDNFNSLNEDLWQIEQYIPSEPEYSFVSYQRPPNAQTVRVHRGHLRIEPKLQQEQENFSNESLCTGSLNLFSGCTRTAESCSVTATGASILPPVVSGRLTSKTFAFTYGVVEIRAKLPQGDWLYPEILLEPLLKKYGTPNFASGIIKIASALGNRELRDGPNEHGNKVLYGGPIMNLACRDVLTERKELYNGSQWGDDFHVYKVRWTPDLLSFKVDDEDWLRVEPRESGLSGRFERFCNIPRTYLSQGTKMAPFDDHFQLTLGVAAGGITEFKDGVITGDGHPKPWSNRNRKASYNFWRDLPAWQPTWRQPALLVDYVKVTAL